MSAPVRVTASGSGYCSRGRPCSAWSQTRIRGRRYREIQRISPRQAAGCTSSPPSATAGAMRSLATPEKWSGPYSRPLPTAVAEFWAQRRYPGLIGEVGLTEGLLQVALLESDADENVSRRRDRKEQVAT